MVGFLQRQGLVEHEPARPGKAAHIALLVAVGHEFVFEGLEPLHRIEYSLGLWKKATISATADTVYS